MSDYELSKAAEADLYSIARYAVEKWGSEQARRYGASLENHFKAVGRREARTRIFFKHRPEMLVSRIERHYVFHLVRENQCPLILAVLHENMDLISRLRDRLED